ncbi:MAG TPA: M23 family metallopeptidase [Opitutaceae bacterium]|nr:M23 family metallopeptidase [Opitutaceae bacterium]
MRFRKFLRAAGFAAAVPLCLFVLVESVRAERLEMVWPTPNTAYFDGKGIADFIQPTASGEPESGLFGCHRTNGAQFHEGVDLKPVRRDRNGEPIDQIFATLPGTVRYINRVPGNSNYGRYILIEHPDTGLPVNTLYAHLSAIAPGLKAGDKVQGGQVIATMGRSSNGSAIPRDRAHLHFEINLLLTHNFQSWYDWKKFGSRNEHGIWNGMNLVGIDPLDFFNAFRTRSVDDFTQYITRLKPAVRVRVATKFTPDFVARYPALLTKALPEGNAFAGWEITFNDMGLPFAWTPLGPMEVIGLRPNEFQATQVDPNARLPRCKSLVFKKRGRYEIGRDLESTLQLLFGVRKEL